MMEKIKESFFNKIIESIEYSEIETALAEMPNCYAKGYLERSDEYITDRLDTDEDFEEVKEEFETMINWDIWK